MTFVAARDRLRAGARPRAAIRVEHTLRPLGVAMAGRGSSDPDKDWPESHPWYRRRLREPPA